MKASLPPAQIVERRLRWTPYIACFAGLVAAVLGHWVPFSLCTFGLGIGSGLSGFAIEWWKMRSRRKSLLLDPAIPLYVSIGFLAARLSEKTIGDSALAVAQYGAIFIFTVAGLFALLRQQWMKTLNGYES